MRALRKSKKKSNRRIEPKQKRRWINPRYLGLAVSVAILLGPMAWVYTLLHDAERFPIERVVVEKGAFVFLNQQQIALVAQPYVGVGFFNLDVSAIQRAIGELAWVDRVSVRRVWPDKLWVQVSEQQPLAQWGKGSLLNRRGEIFTPSRSEMPQGLVRLEGPRGLEKKLAEMYAAVVPPLTTVGLPLKRLELDQRRSWHLEVENGIEFELGRTDPERRLQRFLSVYPSLMAGQDAGVKSVDLRYSNGFAVSWKSPTGAPKSEG
ncbi:cell division protein FtsQ/DivIB [Candidatus Reidiella endopervernicosa]|nr:cell division protein FtsQ/DivIB [Candidatus Reidiella endopervernicosa]QKQ26204.1 FtsQ-type POTRA domain-containing protein [Candidatus Reidiella endopervernicosa]